jgi:zinc/manganese transport system substrate-binding protein
VVTHSILGDVVEQVVGDQADVEVIMGPGTDAHDFAPSAADQALLAEADLIVANGLGFEQALLDSIGAAEADGVPVLELGEQLDPLPLPEGGEHGDEDPHWFTDPLRVADAAGLIGEAVADGVEGVDPATVSQQADAYAEEVRAAAGAIDEQLGALPVDQRTLVTNHEVFGYFADRYGFEIVGTVIPSGTTLAEPSSAELAELVDVIDDAGVPAIFADTSSSDALAETLAAETGEDVAVVELFTESLGEEGSGGATYLELIQTNADRITAALT